MTRSETFIKEAASRLGLKQSRLSCRSINPPFFFSISALTVDSLSLLKVAIPAGLEDFTQGSRPVKREYSSFHSPVWDQAGRAEMMNSPKNVRILEPMVYFLIEATFLWWKSFLELLVSL